MQGQWSKKSHYRKHDRNGCQANIEVPLIIGGGITDPEKAYLNCKAGADVIVIGNAIEKDPSLIKEMATAIHSLAVTV